MRQAVILSEGQGSPSRAAFARDGVAEGSRAHSPARETRVEVEALGGRPSPPPKSRAESREL